MNSLFGSRDTAAAAPAGPPKTDVLVTKEKAIEDLEAAQKDSGITVVKFQEGVDITEATCAAFSALLRGDNRSWEAIAVDMLRKNARWNKINFEGCKGSHLDHCITLLLSLDNAHTLQLSSIRLSQFTAYSLETIAFNTHLKNLELDLLELTDSVPALSRALKRNKSLEVLTTSRCGLNDEMLAELIGALEKHPSIQELKIFGNKCRSKGLNAITELISAPNTAIRLLDLSYQHVGEDEDFDISWLCSAIKKNTSLKTLDLDNCKIDDGHLAHLTVALCENKTLEDLRLNHNHITGEGVALLAVKFTQMKGLKKISMFSNKFDS